MAIHLTEEMTDYDKLGSMARSALDRLIFQPKVDLATGQLCGVETLSRWKHDQSHPPWILAQMGASVPNVDMYCEAYDYVVLTTAMHQCSDWAPRFRSTIRNIAINVTGPTLCSTWLAPLIKRYLSTRALPRLTIELTEPFALTSEASALKTMNTLISYGVSFSLDDFLTGFNQQAVFSRLPFQELKIDREHTQNTSSHKGLASFAEILRSAAARDAVVVAEGIENQHQFKRAKMLGCHQGQGFCISHPLTEPDLLARLSLVGTRPWPTCHQRETLASREQQENRTNPVDKPTNVN